jgi:DNA-3-methyladenine glycosylase II
MSKKPKYWNKAKKYLSNKDKVIKALIKQFKDKTLTTRSDVFFSLCKSIIGQQISVAAADSVFKKFEKLCKGKIKPQKIKFPKIKKMWIK